MLVCGHQRGHGQGGQRHWLEGLLVPGCVFFLRGRRKWGVKATLFIT